MFETTITPRVSETDGAGHINNVFVPVWFEAGRREIFRILTPDLSLETATLCAMVSMDLTMNSNMTVGPPVEVTVYPAGSFSLDRYYRFDEHSEYLRELRRSWDSNLKDAFSKLPPIAWAANWDGKQNRQ